jgi:hypothetical protein
MTTVTLTVVETLQLARKLEEMVGEMIDGHLSEGDVLVHQLEGYDVQLQVCLDRIVKRTYDDAE